jgi:hypothetical protein
MQLRRTVESQQGIMRMLGYRTTVGISILAKAAALRDQHPERFRIGADMVSPGSASAHFSGFAIGTPVFSRLRPDIKLKVSRTNDESTFDDGASASAEGEFCGKFTTTRRDHAR